MALNLDAWSIQVGRLLVICSVGVLSACCFGCERMEWTPLGIRAQFMYTPAAP